MIGRLSMRFLKLLHLLDRKMVRRLLQRLLESMMERGFQERNSNYHHPLVPLQGFPWHRPEGFPWPAHCQAIRPPRQWHTSHLTLTLSIRLLHPHQKMFDHNRTPVFAQAVKTVKDSAANQVV